MHALKLIGLKSHDFHVLMLETLHEILPKIIMHNIRWLCSFFQFHL